MTREEFQKLLDSQVFLIDGAMGTMIQNYGFGPEVYGGEVFQMLSDLLVFSRPDAVKEVHLAYYRSGSNAVETNSFGASPLRLAEFDFSGLDLSEFPEEFQDINRLPLKEFAYKMSYQAIKIGLAAKEEYAASPEYDGRSLAVLGSIGPSNWVLSPTHADLHKGKFDQIEDNFFEQVRAMIDAGVDILLFETQQDMLELKAAVFGAQRAMKECGREVAIITQVTVDQFSKMQIFHTDVQAALVTLQGIGISAFGINCSIGPDLMRPTVEKLVKYSQIPISVIPNAGLPVSENGQTVFKLQPEDFANFIEPYIEMGVNIVGGCCGTSPAHIAALAQKVKGKTPRPRKPHQGLWVSGPQRAIEIDGDDALVRIGERLNVRGSKKVRDAVENETGIDQSVLEEVVKEQVEDLGIEVLDVCMDSNQVNTAETLVSVIKGQCVDFSGAFCIDSFDVEALAEAIKAYPGRPIINSISLEEYAEGLDKVDAVLAVTKAHAPLYIALTTGPEGPAVTKEQKIDLASQILKKAIEKHGQKPEQFLVDINAFPIGSESEEGMNFALESIHSIKGIKALYPGVKTTIGVGNLTNGLAKKPYMRKVLTSVFLDEARKEGLDAAIVNPQHYVPIESLPESDRALGLKIVLERDMDAFALLEEIAEAKKGGPVVKKTRYEDLSDIEAICQKIKDGHKERSAGQVSLDGASYDYADKIVEQVAKVVRDGMEPLVMINDHLMVAMEQLGEGFADGQVSLPHLLKAADVMKQVMGFLETFMKARQGQSGDVPIKGTVVLGTVYQDVHSIGKDLTKTLMENYGYRVIDLGVQVPLAKFVETAMAEGATTIGASALLVQTSNHMITLSKMMEEAGLGDKVDLLIGGAPVSQRHAAQVALAGREDQMRSNVFYCGSAMDGVNILSQLSEGPRRDELLVKNKERLEEALVTGAQRAANQAALMASLPHRAVSERAGAGIEKAIGPQEVHIPLTQFVEKLNQTLLFTLNWKYGGKGGWAKKGITEEQLKADLNAWAERAEKEGWIAPQGVWAVLPCRREGDRLTIYDVSGQKAQGQLEFNDVIGQGKTDRFNVAHYFRSKELDLIGLQLSTAGKAVQAALASLKGEDSEAAWLLQGLSDRVAEDMAAHLESLIRAHLFGSGEATTCRYSPGYPAMQQIEGNGPIFELTEAGPRLGVSLTDGFEFDPTGSTAAVVCFHPEAGYH
ncbi:MAG: homocysteine S-methyltransferase family protein [bacterium]|nr:homocysteine S-methyltransferase family protein [bacterium]